MSISVGDLGTASTEITATISVTIGVGGVPAGALIVVATEEFGSFDPGSSAVTDSKGNTYTQVANGTANNVSAGNRLLTSLWYAKNITALVNGNTIKFTLAQTGDAAAMSAFYATGIQTASPLDTAVTATAFGASAAPSVTSGTPGQAGELFVAFVGGPGNSGTYTQDSGNGWATPFDDSKSGTLSTDSRVSGGNQVNSGTGTLTFAPTLGASSAWWAAIIGFKATATPLATTLFAQAWL